MKFTLKNRPFKDFVPTENLAPECRECIKEPLKWFEGFEKELREILKQGIFDEADNYWTVKLLLEILGDSP